MDELELAEHVLEFIGAENLLLCETGLYRWNGITWRPVTDDAWRHSVQSVLKTTGIKLTGRKVASVATMAKIDVFRDGFEWPHDDGDAVACTNGVARWNETGWNLTKHEREDYRTSTIPVDWDAEATAPRFEQFLAEIFHGDPDAADKATALLEITGYTLMRHSRHEKFVVLVGQGANGKSVLMAVMQALCGTENVAAVAPDQLGRPFQRAALYRKLANIITELRQGEKIEDGALKSIVSGEPCTVEHKFGHPFTMRPYATQIYGTNHLPHTRDFSYALFRRALVVPFNNRFEGAKADKHLVSKLQKELPGVLRLSLDAYGAALSRGGFTEPASCLEAKDKWRMEADQVARYLKEQTQREPGRMVLLKALYDDFRGWADESGIVHKVGKHEFSERLERLGFAKTHKNTGTTFEDLMINAGR